MNYQQVLAISYVFNLMNQLINYPGSHSSNHKEIIKLENTFYIQDPKKNLYLIQDNMNRSDNNIKVLLDTFILFEENKLKPMDIYLKIKNNNRLRIDYELLKNLQMQYITNKSYFENDL